MRKKRLFFCKACGAVTMADGDGRDLRCDECGAYMMYFFRTPSVVRARMIKDATASRKNILMGR